MFLKNVPKNSQIHWSHFLNIKSVIGLENIVQTAKICPIWSRPLGRLKYLYL
jgi:hypothetical protein